MIISVPWPYQVKSQDRIKESISLWPNREMLLLCCVNPCDDEFLLDYRTQVMPRNSSDIGSKFPKCYIYDMLLAARDIESDWYGFANSDIVPVGNLEAEFADYEVLVYHRTEILSWDHMTNCCNRSTVPLDAFDFILEQRSLGFGDKKVARLLNLSSHKPPQGCSEWTYDVVRNVCSEQGEVFFWGQDMFLFRKDVFDKILSEYMQVFDPIISTGGFDPRLSKYLLENYHGTRVLNKIFHKRHDSEWNVNEVEFKHNGGDIVRGNVFEFYGQDYINSMQESGYRAAIPRHLRYLLQKHNPEGFIKMFGQSIKNSQNLA